MCLVQCTRTDRIIAKSAGKSKRFCRSVIVFCSRARRLVQERPIALFHPSQEKKQSDGADYTAEAKRGGKIPIRQGAKHQIDSNGNPVCQHTADAECSGPVPACDLPVLKIRQEGLKQCVGEAKEQHADDGRQGIGHRAECQTRYRRKTTEQGKGAADSQPPGESGRICPQQSQQGGSDIYQTNHRAAYPTAFILKLV